MYNLSTTLEKNCNSYGCTLFCPLCIKFVCCVRCHINEIGEGLDHWDKATNESKDVFQVKCKHCQLQQPLTTDKCISCQKTFASYVCTKCPTFNSTLVKDQLWHCDDCEVCRRGNKDEFEHCLKCCMCVKKGVHQCYNNTCPICLDSVSKSFDHIVQLPCNHSIHKSCWVSTMSNCPICRQCVVKVITDDFTKNLWTTSKILSGLKNTAITIFLCIEYFDS